MFTFDATINIPMLGVGLVTIIGFTGWIQSLKGRVDVAESKNRDLQDKVNLQSQAMGVLSDALNALRMDMMKGYATAETMAGVARKIDDLSSTVAKLGATQASQGATLVAIKEALDDVKGKL
jgi:hypothetical protein